MQWHCYNLGNVLEKKGEIDEAIEYYVEALRIKPGYAEAQNNLGIALFKKRDYERAVLHFAKALEINPQDTGARNNLANVLFIQGKPMRLFPIMIKYLMIQRMLMHIITWHILSTQGLSCITL